MRVVNSANDAKSIAVSLGQSMAELDVRTTFAAYESVHKSVGMSSNVLINFDVPYGEHERQRLDYYYNPAASRASVLVFVHGGGFSSGHRRLSSQSPFYGNIGLWAARAGIDCAVISYRLAPEYRWPTGSDDLGLALDAIASGLLGRRISRQNINIFGHSAGAAHVAGYISLEASRGHLRPCGVAAILSGLYDLPTVGARAEPISVYFGADRNKWVEKSSSDGLVDSNVPLFVGYAEHDPTDFRLQAAELLARLGRACRSAEGAMFRGHTHISEIASIGTEDVSVSDALLGFLTNGHVTGYAQSIHQSS